MGIGHKGSVAFRAWFYAVAVGLPFAATPTSISAQSSVTFDIPAGRLSNSIRTLARQAGISVASRESGLRRLRVRAVRGALSPREALRRLLAGTGYRAVAVSGGFRIERAPATRAPTRRVAPASPEPPIAPRAPPIVVEGTKRALAASDYPGGVKIISLDDPAALGAGISLDTALANEPAVNGTALGSGRNKIFLRGVADSSFNGPTPSTIGLYLGEQRLIYSAPNPDLKLYDAETIEVLEGPQGTLYGAGTIAGLVRMNPRAPDPSTIESEGWASGGYTKSGGLNWDAGAVANVPVADDAALRVVGYGGEESGYIDDRARRLTGINTASHYGGRAALAFGVGPDWDVSVSGFGQHTESRDGQYVDQRFAGLERASRAGQPFRGRIYGGALTVQGALGVLELTSTTGLVDHALRSVFDSSILVQSDGTPGFAEPSGPLSGAAIQRGRQIFRETRAIRLLSHETRLSGGDPDGVSGLVGASALRNRDTQRQIVINLEPGAPDPPPFANLTYRLDEFAVFGEGSLALSEMWKVTAGARVLYTSVSGERSFGPTDVVEPRDGPVRLLPALALSWRPDDRWMAYIRAQEGFRTGGVTIERDLNNDPDVAQFDPDKVRSVEAGLRASLGKTAPIELALTAHHSDWDDIQADILDRNGFPLTRNIGDGRVTGVDGSVRFRGSDGWDLTVLAAFNDTQVGRLLPDGGVRSAALPNVPDVSALARVGKRWTLRDGREAGAAVTGRYVGRSFLDLDQLARVEQGDFGSIDAALWWEGKRWGVRLEALNLTNTRGNRFAFGNPFTARREDQATPLRPLTVRVQIHLRR